MIILLIIVILAINFDVYELRLNQNIISGLLCSISILCPILLYISAIVGGRKHAYDYIDCDFKAYIIWFAFNLSCNVLKTLIRAFTFHCKRLYFLFLMALTVEITDMQMHIEPSCLLYKISLYWCCIIITISNSAINDAFFTPLLSYQSKVGAFIS